MVKNEQENRSNLEKRTIEKEDEEEPKLEMYDSWGAPEYSRFSFKPIALTSLSAFLVGVVGLSYLFYNDPAAVWDRATDRDSDSPGRIGDVKTASTAPKLLHFAENTPEVPITHNSEVKPPPIISEPATRIPEVVTRIPEAVITAETPPPSAPDTASTGDYDSLLATAMATRGNKNKIAAFKTAISANPTGDKALSELAILLMNRSATRPEASELAERALKANPDNAAAWLVIGYINQFNGNTVRAKEAFKKCLKAPGPKNYVRECRRM